MRFLYEKLMENYQTFLLTKLCVTIIKIKYYKVSKSRTIFKTSVVLINKKTFKLSRIWPD